MFHQLFGIMQAFVVGRAFWQTRQRVHGEMESMRADSAPFTHKHTSGVHMALYYDRVSGSKKQLRRIFVWAAATYLICLAFL